MGAGSTAVTPRPAGEPEVCLLPGLPGVGRSWPLFHSEEVLTGRECGSLLVPRCWVLGTRPLSRALGQVASAQVLAGDLCVGATASVLFGSLLGSEV